MFTSKAVVLFMTFLFAVITSVSGNLSFMHSLHGSRVKVVLCSRVVTWYMGSGLKAQNLTGIRAQRRGLRAQKNEIRDHKTFEPESGIIFITRSKNLLSQYFSA